jgi:hypothetical protein
MKFGDLFYKYLSDYNYGGCKFTMQRVKQQIEGDNPGCHWSDSTYYKHLRLYVEAGVLCNYEEFTLYERTANPLPGQPLKAA